mmetsp:Transcript_54207/g.100166  ORF Transcript_54207/g.100166 Transcript_54207/m.100166 type:complete len:294 (-) Transcript_54207:39-920(-)
MQERTKVHARQARLSGKITAQGTCVYFAIARREYVVDVVEMLQRSSKTRRQVQRDDRGVWSFNAAHFSGQKAVERKPVQWEPYSPELQRILEGVFQKLSPRLQSNVTGTEAPDDVANSLPDSPEAALKLVLSMEPGTISEEQMRTAWDIVHKPHVHRTLAVRTATELLARHRWIPTAADARTVALSLGSLSVLHLIFTSLEDGNGPQVMGLHIFDRAYPGHSVQDEAQKWCMKVLLSRGAVLGDPKYVPSKSKLLKKIEAEAFQSWVARYFRSLSLTGVELPDHVQSRIREFL